MLDTAAEQNQSEDEQPDQPAPPARPRQPPAKPRERAAAEPAPPKKRTRKGQADSSLPCCCYEYAPARGNTRTRMGQEARSLKEEKS